MFSGRALAGLDTIVYIGLLTLMGVIVLASTGAVGAACWLLSLHGLVSFSPLYGVGGGALVGLGIVFYLLRR